MESVSGPERNTFKLKEIDSLCYGTSQKFLVSFSLLLTLLVMEFCFQKHFLFVF
jgi:hypothetical protein